MLFEVFSTVLLGIILGISEFLPVSSVGHSLVLSSLLSFPPTKVMRDSFAVFIEGGALLAVFLFFLRDLLSQMKQVASSPAVRQLWLNVVVAFLPVGIVGFIFHDWVERVLFSPLVVGISLIVGGIAFLLVERRKQPATTVKLEDMTLSQALWVGIAQIGALIPGVSRSGSTIIGGLLVGLDRSVATLFTFYLFLPTLTAASGYEIFHAIQMGTIAPDLMPYFFLAAFVGFIVSLFAMRWLLNYVHNHTFEVFGVYRIVVGVIVLALVAVGRL